MSLILIINILLWTQLGTTQPEIFAPMNIKVIYDYKFIKISFVINIWARVMMESNSGLIHEYICMHKIHEESHEKNISYPNMCNDIQCYTLSRKKKFSFFSRCNKKCFCTLFISAINWGLMYFWLLVALLLFMISRKFALYLRYDTLW